MCNWTIKAASKCTDLIELMKDKTREGPMINMDETTLQVLKEPGKKADSKSQMWVTVGTDSNHKVILFNYSRSRNAQIAESLLDGFTGSLQTDGYAGYNSAVKEHKLWHVGCLAHVRRNFFNAAKATKSGGQANRALKWIKSLYRIEKELRKQELDAQEFVLQRRRKAIPILKDFRKWLGEKKGSVLPSSDLGKAINYALSEYVKLVRYLKYDYLTPDNNAAENAIRPFVVGRKNWMFSDTPKGAYASATLYSLVETAKANDIEPMAYLNHIFTRLPLVSEKKELELLLPWNIRKEELNIRK
jgi:transposase